MWPTKSFHESTLSHQKIRRIIDLSRCEPGELVWCIGTLYKRMKLKPNVLSELQQKSGAETGVAFDNPRVAGQFVSKGDTFEVEDESGRVVLVLPPKVRFSCDLSNFPHTQHR